MIFTSDISTKPPGAVATGPDFERRVVAGYKSSRLRRLMYPAERWATRLVRALTRN